MDDLLPNVLEKMDRDRLRRYRDNLDFYNGLQWQDSSQANHRRLTFNYSKGLLAQYLALN